MRGNLMIWLTAVALVLSFAAINADNKINAMGARITLIESTIHLGGK